MIACPSLRCGLHTREGGSLACMQRDGTQSKEGSTFRRVDLGPCTRSGRRVELGVSRQGSSGA